MPQRTGVSTMIRNSKIPILRKRIYKIWIYLSSGNCKFCGKWHFETHLSLKLKHICPGNFSEPSPGISVSIYRPHGDPTSNNLSIIFENISKYARRTAFSIFNLLEHENNQIKFFVYLTILVDLERV
jgi:hypothetical protein